MKAFCKIGYATRKFGRDCRNTRSFDSLPRPLILVPSLLPFVLSFAHRLPSHPLNDALRQERRNTIPPEIETAGVSLGLPHELLRCPNIFHYVRYSATGQHLSGVIKQADAKFGIGWIGIVMPHPPQSELLTGRTGASEVYFPRMQKADDLCQNADASLHAAQLENIALDKFTPCRQLRRFYEIKTKTFPSPRCKFSRPSTAPTEEISH